MLALPCRASSRWLICIRGSLHSVVLQDVLRLGELLLFALPGLALWISSCLDLLVTDQLFYL